MFNQHPLKVCKCNIANFPGVKSFLLPLSVVMILNSGLFFRMDEDVSVAHVSSSLMWLVFVSTLSSVVNKSLSIFSAELKGPACSLILSRIANFLFSMWNRSRSFWISPISCRSFSLTFHSAFYIIHFFDISHLLVIPRYLTSKIVCLA